MDRISPQELFVLEKREFDTMGQLISRTEQGIANCKTVKDAKELRKIIEFLKTQLLDGFWDRFHLSHGLSDPLIKGWRLYASRVGKATDALNFVQYRLNAM